MEAQGQQLSGKTHRVSQDDIKAVRAAHNKRRASTTQIVSYSPFWPILIVFIALATVGVWQMMGLLETRRSLFESLKQTQQRIPRAQIVINTREAIRKELFLLSSVSPEAKKIVQEFRIQYQVPPQGSTPSSTP